MKTILVVVNGVSGSGKDSFVNFAMEHMKTRGCPAVKHSTIDTPKEMAILGGWNGEKNGASRVMLEDLKQWWIKHFNGPCVETGKVIRNVAEMTTPHQSGTTAVIFTMIREPDEIKKMVNWCAEAGFISYTVCVNGHGDIISKDVHVTEYDYSDYIDNSSSLHQLNLEALNFINAIM